MYHGSNKREGATSTKAAHMKGLSSMPWRKSKEIMWFFSDQCTVVRISSIKCPDLIGYTTGFYEILTSSHELALFEEVMLENFRHLLHYRYVRQHPGT